MMLTPKTLGDFTGIYQLSKTLRFELKPHNKTLEHIQKNGLLQRDEQRADAYTEVKKLIDRFHKHFMEYALRYARIDGLEQYAALYWKREKDKTEKNDFEKLQDKMRKQIADAFNKSTNAEVKEMRKKLFDKELIREVLPSYLTDEKEKALVHEFKDFTSYFVGFHQNRENIYTHEPESTAAAYRLVHDNLPKFLDNVRVWEMIKNEEAYSDLDVSSVEREMDDVLQGKTLDEIFSIEYYNQCLTQTDIDLYNTLLGGRSTEGQKKIQGLNELINLYNQRKSEDAKKHGDKKWKRVPQFKPLYKQILSDRESSSFVLEEIKTDNELLQGINNLHAAVSQTYEKDGKEINVLNDIAALMSELKDSEHNKVFVRNDVSLTNISQQLFGDWAAIKNALEFYYTNILHPANEKERKQKKYEEAKTRWLKRKAVSIEEIETALYHYRDEAEQLKPLEINENSHPVCDYFTALLEGDKDLLKEIVTTYADAKDLLHTEYPADKDLKQDKENVALIKAYLDSVKALLHFIKPLHPERIEGEKDGRFYATYQMLFDELNKVTPLYNKTRNYLTQKPYSTEKVKLNFENSTLLNGWDENKETDNTSVLLRKDGLYYLAVMDKKHNKVFQKLLAHDGTSPAYEKIVYKFFPDASKMIPKCSTQLKEVVAHYSKSDADKTIKGGKILKELTITKRIFDLNNCGYDSNKKQMVRMTKDDDKLPKQFQKSYVKESGDAEGYRRALAEWIGFCKQFLEAYESTCDYPFAFKPNEQYESLDEFYKDIDAQTYKISFKKVSEKYINELVDAGKIYLFQIYNKDFSAYSKGKPNLHTMYWKMLFDEINLNDVVLRLNGGGEIFYRKKSLNYDEQTLRVGHHAAQLKDKFTYPIISNRRYAFDKFQFHVPITLNSKASGADNINTDVLNFLHRNPSVNIIGIDRGERHLLYLTLIDQNGKILEQKSLNELFYTVKGETTPRSINYHDKLNAKEEERKKARVEWGVVENIKELKEGYLSHIVHEVAKMMVQHNAILVMEDLNFGFKRGRQKVEKQVYQKFEKMLIDKLNYLVFKDKAANEPGGALKAFQLANKFESFQKLGKQSGFIFYVPAALTSKIDPVTGFVDFLKPKYESVKSAQEFWSNFESINYNAAKQWFEFTFDYKKFTDKAEASRTRWTVCSTPHTRYRWNPKANNGKGEQEPVNVTQEIEDLLGSYNIAYGDGANLRDAIASQSEADFHKRLLRSLATLLMLRHNNGKKGEDEQDYILSPVEPFFCSLDASDKRPKDADANGAYHIAKKGLYLLNEKLNNMSTEEFEKTKQSKDGKSQWLPNSEWLKYVQSSHFSKHEYLLNL